MRLDSWPLLGTSQNNDKMVPTIKKSNHWVTISNATKEWGMKIQWPITNSLSQNHIPKNILKKLLQRYDIAIKAKGIDLYSNQE